MFIFSTKNVSIGSWFVKFSPLPNYVVLSFTFCIPINILRQPLTKLLYVGCCLRVVNSGHHRYGCVLRVFVSF